MKLLVSPLNVVPKCANLRQQAETKFLARAVAKAMATE